ncbi:hypothetical protein ID866_7114 [Astraeus odoratus]|nr:hypothetical protein ID866_7114 [Astraeus odoratus]
MQSEPEQHAPYPLPQTVPTSEPRSDDPIIIIIGPAGSGKSSFIAKATGNADRGVGHELYDGPYTREITATNCGIEECPTVVLVDTPGFDDRERSDVLRLASFSRWLDQT